MQKDHLKPVYEAIVLLFLVATLAGVSISQYFCFDLYEFYSKKLQIPLFTGFLTVGSFLLALKTGLLIKLKEGLYDTKAYHSLVVEQRQINPNLSFYGPLTRLGKFLVVTVVSALSTSFLQITLGWIPFKVVAAIAMATALTTSVMVIICWYYIRGNLNYWFRAMEKEAEKKIDEEKGNDETARRV